MKKQRKVLKLLCQFFLTQLSNRFFFFIWIAIRDVDTETIIFYEPVTWAIFSPYDYNPTFDAALDVSFQHMNIFDAKSLLENICGPLEATISKENLKLSIEVLLKDVDYPVLGPGFSQVPGGQEYQNRSVFSWHYYCQFLDKADISPKGILTEVFCDLFWGPSAFSTVEKRVQELGGGQMLTEVIKKKKNKN